MGRGSKPETVATLTMLPPLLACMAWMPCRIPRKTPSRFTDSTRRHSSSDVSAAGRHCERAQELPIVVGERLLGPHHGDEPVDVATGLRGSHRDGDHIAAAGLSLARMEGQVAIGRLVARCGTIAPAGAPTRSGRARFRGFLRYPVRLA